MPPSCLIAGSLALVFLAAPAHSQSPAAWKDLSPHKTLFVNVGQNVSLEVLDWGGSGQPLVLLAGGGNTAHVFDDFAPKLTSGHHVYGITRRGFGASGFLAAGYGAGRLGDDVLAVMDSLHLGKAVLVGHSIGGEELSSVATRHPERVVALVYLDAAYPYAFDNGKGPSFEEIQATHGPQPPQPAAADLDSFAALQAFYVRLDGFRFPESELRQQRQADGGRVGKDRDFPGYATIMTGMQKYAHIPAPVLAIFANPHSQGPWIDKSTDPAVREAARKYSAALTSLVTRQIKAFKDGVPTARVVELPGAHHYVFLSNEADVLREMRAFLGSLH